MTLEEIKKALAPSIRKAKNYLNKQEQNQKNNSSDNASKLSLIISTALKQVLANPVLNPIMKYVEAELYYFNSADALKHMQDKYMLIIDLQAYITQELYIPFIYDKYIILKLLQLTLTTYNEFLDQCQNGVNARNEDIANLFIDIETMMFNDRNASAENRTKNAKAIDVVNRYSRKIGGFGATFEKEKKEEKKEILVFTAEESQRKLAEFGYSKMLENNDK